MVKAYNKVVEAMIRKSLAVLVYELWKDSKSIQEHLKQNKECYLLINSSFLYRDKKTVKTLQSSKRLLAKVVGAEEPEVQEVIVKDDVTLKSHYIILESPGPSETLETSVAAELTSLGDVIFILLGTLTGLRSTEQMVNNEYVQTLRLDENVKKELLFENGICTINRILPIEDLLQKIGSSLPKGSCLTSKDKENIGKAYNALLDTAISEVIIDPKDERDTILGRIADSLQEQVKNYEAALKNLEEDPKDQTVLYEILRVAYNFSTDVLPLVFLFMSICDLKPLVFWCTIDKHWALRQAFAALPWSALGRKERLQDYREIVAGARNQAFHHFLPFNATIEVDLTNMDVRAEKLRLFPPYGQKQRRGVQLKDQELIDVLSEFSRAKQRPVSLQFWKLNFNVMKATADLANAMLETLLLIWNNKRS